MIDLVDDLFVIWLFFSLFVEFVDLVLEVNFCRFSFPCFIFRVFNRNMYLLTEWEGRTGKYLARGQDVRTERSEVRAS